MKKVAFVVVGTWLSYHFAASFVWLYVGVHCWWENREEESLREVLSDVEVALDRARARRIALGLSPTTEGTREEA